MRGFFLTLFLTVYFSVSGQVDTFQNNIIDCLNINGTPAEYSDIYEQNINILKDRYKTANVPQEFWRKLSSDKEKKVNEIISILAFAYRKHFIEEDIELMTVFYKTEVAQVHLNESKLLTEDQKNEIYKFQKSEIGIKMEANQEE